MHLKSISSLFLFLTFLSSKAQLEASYFIFDRGEAFCFIPSGILNKTAATVPTPRPNTIASICDRNGVLQFYTDGNNVWNSSNELMPNGTGLAGNPCGNQTAVIVPIEESRGKLYYVFTADNGGILTCNANFFYDSVFSYSIVDMSLNNGHGDVISKNNVLVRQVNGLIAATKHANGIDTWVVTRQFSTNAFYVFKVTSCGISAPQKFILGGNEDVTSGRTLQFSPDGNWLCAPLLGKYIDSSIVLTNYLFRFNTNTGEIASDFILLHNVTNGICSAFSPNSKIFYTTDFSGRLFQYDLSSNNKASIIQSKIQIPDSNPNPGYWTMFLGIDGKMYISKALKYNLDIIVNPNNYGSTVQYIDDGLISTNGQHGQPGFISSYFKPGYISPTINIGDLDFISNHRYCGLDSIRFALNGQFMYDSLSWTYQNIHSGHSYKSTKVDGAIKLPTQGNYIVSLYRYYKCSYDIVVKDMYLDSLPVTDWNDTMYFCNKNSKTIYAPLDQQSYSWNNNANNLAQYTSTIEEEVYLTMTNTCGTFKDSTSLTYISFFNGNLITPNADNKNDRLEIICKGDYKPDVTIYNSWGSLVFQKEKYQNEWPTENIENGIYFIEKRIDDCIEKEWIQILK